MRLLLACAMVAFRPYLGAGAGYAILGDIGKPVLGGTGSGVEIDVKPLVVSRGTSVHF